MDPSGPNPQLSLCRTADPDPAIGGTLAVTRTRVLGQVRRLLSDDQAAESGRPSDSPPCGAIG